jgi:hypothetical protein
LFLYPGRMDIRSLVLRKKVLNDIDGDRALSCSPPEYIIPVYKLLLCRFAALVRGSIFPSDF